MELTDIKWCHKHKWDNAVDGICPACRIAALEGLLERWLRFVYKTDMNRHLSVVTDTEKALQGDTTEGKEDG